MFVFNFTFQIFDYEALTAKPRRSPRIGKDDNSYSRWETNNEENLGTTKTFYTPLKQKLKF